VHEIAHVLEAQIRNYRQRDATILQLKQSYLKTLKILDTATQCLYAEEDRSIRLQRELNDMRSNLDKFLPHWKELFKDTREARYLQKSIESKYRYQPFVRNKEKASFMSPSISTENNHLEEASANGNEVSVNVEEDSCRLQEPDVHNALLDDIERLIEVLPLKTRA
jgi:hypothetical protein